MCLYFRKTKGPFRKSCFFKKINPGRSPRVPRFAANGLGATNRAGSVGARTRARSWFRDSETISPSPDDRFLGRFLGRGADGRFPVPLASSEGAWSAASPPPLHSSSAPARASGLRVRCRASASERTRRLGARRARRRSRRSRARRPRASSARPSSSPSRFPRRWRATPRGPPPPDPGPPFRRVTPPRVSVQTTPSPRRAARRRATGTRPRARRSSPPLALASVPSFGATRRLLSRRIRIRLSPPPRAPRRRPARRYRSTAPWRRSGSRTSRAT